MKELIRVYNILTLFEKKRYFSKDEILKAVSQGEENIISYETWNRLRKKLERDYDFIVSYNKKDDLYSMSFGDRVNKERLLEIIDHFKMMNLLTSYIEGNKGMVEHIEFDNRMNMGGEENLNTLQNAMLNLISVRITHKGYWSTNFYTYEINPLYFKQYQNRWYLIAELKEKGEFRAFGMDRISNVTYTKKLFKSRIIEAKQRFSKIVGVDLNGNGLQDIIIVFDPSQKRYLESLALHHSQTVIEDNERQYVIRLHVDPNYELQQQIQKFGGLATVVEGDWICW